MLGKNTMIEGSDLNIKHNEVTQFNVFILLVLVTNIEFVQDRLLLSDDRF